MSILIIPAPAQTGYTLPAFFYIGPLPREGCSLFLAHASLLSSPSSGFLASGKPYFTGSGRVSYQ